MIKVLVRGVLDEDALLPNIYRGGQNKLPVAGDAVEIRLADRDWTLVGRGQVVSTNEKARTYDVLVVDVLQ